MPTEIVDALLGLVFALLIAYMLAGGLVGLAVASWEPGESAKRGEPGQDGERGQQRKIWIRRWGPGQALVWCAGHLFWSAVMGLQYLEASKGFGSFGWFSAVLLFGLTPLLGWLTRFIPEEAASPTRLKDEFMKQVNGPEDAGGSGCDEGVGSVRGGSVEFRRDGPAGSGGADDATESGHADGQRPRSAE